MPIIKEVKGNLLTRFDQGEFQAIAHGCNAFLTFGAGIAKQIKDQYPQAYKADLTTLKADKKKMGTYTYAQSGEQYIFNLYTQFTFWDRNNMLDYDALGRAFSALNTDMPKKFNITTLGIPAIGAGLAMGDWSQIVKIINESTPELDITFVEYQP